MVMPMVMHKKWNDRKWQEMTGNDRKWQEMTGNDTSGNVRKLWQKATSRMKLEKTFHDEIQQILELGSPVKVIPWTAGESSRSKNAFEIYWPLACANPRNVSTKSPRLPFGNQSTSQIDLCSISTHSARPVPNRVKLKNTYRFTEQWNFRLQCW